MIFFWKYRYAFLALGVLLAILSYGAYKKHQGEVEAQTQAEIADLKTDNEVYKKSADIKRKQDEIQAIDITPRVLGQLLLDGKF